MVTLHGPRVGNACCVSGVLTAPEALLARIRGEYREMPGLRLSFAQACRLWHVDAPTCQAVLDQLLRERFLFKTDKGAFVALPGGRGQLKAALAQRPVPQSA